MQFKMLRYLYVLLIIAVFTPYSICGFCGNANRRISDPLSCSRYRECSNGIWQVVNCPYNTTFDGTICKFGASCNIHKIWKTSNFGDQIDGTSTLNGGSQAENSSESSGQIAEVNDGFTAVNRSRRQTTYKSYKSFTETKNGRKITTLWYYNSNGPNYKFAIYGDPPAPRDEMIEWLETNSHRYKVTPVPYKGDADEIPVTDAPTQRPTPAAPPTRKPVVQQPPRKPSNTGMTAAAFLPSECGLSGKQLRDKIVGGDLADIEESPWQAALLRKDTKQLSCGGSIISKRHVVTATHCFRSKTKPTDNKPTFVNKEDRLVAAGATILNDDISEHVIFEVYLHGLYTEETRRNDIALIIIVGEFAFGAKIYPICLPVHQEKFNPGRECKISGWGRVAANVKYTETKLRSAQVKITTDSQCKKENAVASRLTIGAGMVCAGNYEKGGVDTCQGDSGGPLACEEEARFRLFGVTSWGIGCGEAKYPGVYTKVTEYVKWIKNRIEVSIGARDRSSLTLADDYEETDVGKGQEDEEDYVEKDIE